MHREQGGSSMNELLAGYAEAGPLVTGLLLFPLGLAIGSFSSVLCHRLALGQSIVWPRSHCPTCHHPLSPLDLVPVLSFVWLRGRCRYCTLPIPWRYPALELASGVIAAGCGFLGGWGAGFAALLLWVAGAVLVTGSWRRKSDAGITLVEVLVAVSLLVVVMIPMLNFRTVVAGTAIFQRQIAITLASGKIEEVMDQSYRSDEGEWGYPTDHWFTEAQTVGQYNFTRAWKLVDYDAANPWLKQVVVEVTCVKCSSPIPPVRLTTVLAKIPQPDGD
jgi:Tfp pilus assembly protein PilV